ncbi:glycoside hydrolase family 3 N-terminal domain-containing protein [Rhizosphaericola mali]|uniref:beta-N-acetylhexosaminidase n=1 Tax=Rhizosphaericola mali TaxID=2545455 RepID=A0A5P2GG38_9BACT|nr:glycoside hydrolase family 3 N-terminal domain-containing protein [Rhizosphaericola mali]QES90651.1 serine hydrolase [Rhizosphaericola mali]
MKKKLYTLAFLLASISVKTKAQDFLQHTPAADNWVDSVFQTLSQKNKIAQLMVLRESSTKDGQPIFFDKDLLKQIKKYGIGSICVFQGSPIVQAPILNKLQATSKIPLLVCIDGEMGLGMRMTEVAKFPDQLTMGAMNNPDLVYRIGAAMAEQCKRMGIQNDYAPVVDINNNPNNPVIGYRSFGQDKYKVAQYGVRIMRGMQDNGVMATAKHFPGHGDVAVDSHLDLPIINKSIAALDTLEFYPFRAMFDSGVASVMIAHLSIPAIDSTPNLATSLSPKNVNGLLRNEFKFKGISFTDALEMKGVAKFFPAGKASVQSLIAGNDMLCLPGDIDNSIKQIQAAIKSGELKQEDLDFRVKKVLLAKYNLGLSQKPVVDTTNLVADLNKDVPDLRAEVAQNAMTLIKLENPNVLHLDSGKVAYVSVGDVNTELGKELNGKFKADIFEFSFKDDASAANALYQKIQDGKYDKVVIGLHDFSKRPANNFGISDAAIDLIKKVDQNNLAFTYVFGNPYAVKLVLDNKNIAVAYEDDSIFQHAAFLTLAQEEGFKGQLPVTIADAFPYGYGLTKMPMTYPTEVGLSKKKLKIIDSIVDGAIKEHAFPGCEVLVARNGQIAFMKNYGYMTYDSLQPVATRDIYDLASCTKITATTISVMRLFEEGKLDLNKTLGDYLPWVKNTDKAPLKIRDILLHQAGLVAFIPFYKAVIDSVTGVPLPQYFHTVKDAQFSVEVAPNLYLRRDYLDTVQNLIVKSKLGPMYNYVYSDNDFIFLGKIVEKLSGLPLNEYVKTNFYEPLGMTSTTFLPLENNVPISQIAPTEHEKNYRQQQLRGTVHDPGAALMGGVAGHAGLYSDAYDLSKLYNMLLNGGEWEGKRYFKKSTIAYFTAYNTPFSRRGLGFDKPQMNSKNGETTYPSKYASPLTFGHTGYTGTCIWADPKEDLLFVFLSNRVYPDGGENVKINKLNVRENILDAVYQAIQH